MHPLRFQWHPNTKAFAGKNIVARSNEIPASPLIPTHPVSHTLAQLSAVLGNNTGFCVTDQMVPKIRDLTANQFATLTGGTSGTPKVIARSQASWIDSFHANATNFNYTTNDSIAVLGGLGHSLALYGILEGLHLGLNVHALSPLRPPAQASHLLKHKCSILYATPTQLRLLPAQNLLPDVRLILCGGGALNPATQQHIATLFPNATLHVFYGAAETSFITLGDTATPQGSVGHAYRNVKIDIRSPDAAGIGTVWVNSPYLFDSYLQGNSPYTKRQGDWVTVGEHGHLNDAGYLFLRGRAGRAVNIADQTVHLDSLEAEIAAIAGVTACVLLARPDPLRGHHLIAVIEGAEKSHLRHAIKDHCKQHNLHNPREIKFLDLLPQLPSGKPDLQRIALLTGSLP